MFKKILLPLDGSKVSEIALPYGRQLAEKMNSELILFHVCGQGHDQQEHMHMIYLDSLAETLKQTSKKGQNSNGITVSTMIETNGPEEDICNLVGKNDIDLIVMTAISTSGLKVGKMIGSVADHVCRTVPTPVLLIRPQKTKIINDKKQLINRILLTLDGSELSKKVLPVGEELVSKLKIPLTLFQMARVVMPYSDEISDEVFLDYEKLSDAERYRVQNEMTVLEKELKDKGFDVNYEVVSGVSAADEIIDESIKINADLIVMSTHGRSGLSRWLLGNVAEKVLRHSTVPVLLVNARAN